MCEKRPKRERVCRALSALSALSDLSLSLSLSANACYYVSKRDAYVRCICVRVCVYLFSQLTKSFLKFVLKRERNVPEERKEEIPQEKERQKNMYKTPHIHTQPT